MPRRFTQKTMYHQSKMRTHLKPDATLLLNNPTYIATTTTT
jgi:hypothetical protein